MITSLCGIGPHYTVCVLPLSSQIIEQWLFEQEVCPGSRNQEQKGQAMADPLVQSKRIHCGILQGE